MGARSVVACQGEIWRANLPEPRGSEPGFRRPVLVVQANTFNGSKIGAVIVVAITTNLTRAKSPGNVVLGGRDLLLLRPCVINVSQVMTIDKAWLGERVGVLSTSLMQEVDLGLCLVHNLPV